MAVTAWRFSMKTVKPGHGYWDCTAYPIGGCFRRAGSQGVRVVEVLSTHKRMEGKGTTEIGLTADGRKIAYDHQHTR